MLAACSNDLGGYYDFGVSDNARGRDSLLVFCLECLRPVLMKMSLESWSRILAPLAKA
jgi:hypothetical protein